MMHPSEVRVWEPKTSVTLTGAFHLEGGLNWTIQTEDGMFWLLVTDAESLVQRSLGLNRLGSTCLLPGRIGARIGATPA